MICNQVESTPLSSPIPGCLANFAGAKEKALKAAQKRGATCVHRIVRGLCSNSESQQSCRRHIRAQIHTTPPRLCWRTPSSRSGEQPGTVRVPSESKQKGEESRNLLPLSGVEAGSRCPRSGGHIRRVKRHSCTPGTNITRPGSILTLFLVQHHGPKERGVLPRAIRPRLQEAGPFALAQSFSWKRL